MQSEKNILNDQSIRERIMDAALGRFRHYGYNKTTMAEIATDSGMSTANIYRYFENKQEIASLCVSNCILERINLVKQASSQSDRPAADQLRNFVQTLLKNCHDTYSQDEKIHELVLFVTNEHPEIIHNKIARLQEQLIAILKNGNQSGEFNITDPAKTARAIYSSIAVFDVPLFMNFYPLEEFQRRADGVVDLILTGLNIRNESCNGERSPA